MNRSEYRRLHLDLKINLDLILKTGTSDMNTSSFFITVKTRLENSLYPLGYFQINSNFELVCQQNKKICISFVSCEPEYKIRREYL